MAGAAADAADTAGGCQGAMSCGCGWAAKIGFTVDGTQIPAFQLEMCPPGVRELRLSQSQMEQILYTLCGGAVHAHQTELAAGYITIPGGCRVGVGGHLLHPQQGVILQSLCSMNLRIAREKNMPLPLALTQALKGHFVGFLLVGEPDSGKTTLLRHLARHLARSRGSVTVIDERRELFPQKGGAGEMLDVLSGLPKGLAVEMALRTLSPRRWVPAGRAGGYGGGGSFGTRFFQRGGFCGQPA